MSREVVHYAYCPGCQRYRLLRPSGNFYRHGHG